MEVEGGIRLPEPVQTKRKRTRIPHERRRAEIIASAAKLFAEKGVASTTVRDIGDDVGLLSGSLYHYFESKEAIVRAIVVGFLTWVVEDYDAIAETVEDPRERFEAIVRASFAALDRGPYALQIYQNEYKYLGSLPELSDIHTLSKAIRDHWLDCISAAIESGQFRSDLDPGVVYRLARSAVWYSVRWYDREGPLSLKRVGDDCLEMLMSGIAAPTR